MRIITTGSSSIDKMLGGGIRTGLITNILSDSRDARSSMCYSLCVNAAQGYKNSSIIFGDTQGFYRPEKILSLNVQMVLVNYALNLRPILIIIDNFSYLFLNERKRLLSVQIFLRKHLHDLAISAIDNDIAIVLTNPVFAKKENIDSGDIFEKKSLPYNELLNKIISNHAHVVLELKTVKVNESRFSARALKPITADKSYLIARQDGLYDC